HGGAAEHKLQLLEPENLKDQGRSARCEKDRGDQRSVRRACRVRAAVGRIIRHWINLPLAGRIATAGVVKFALDRQKPAGFNYLINLIIQVSGLSSEQRMTASVQGRRAEPDHEKSWPGDT